MNNRTPTAQTLSISNDALELYKGNIDIRSRSSASGLFFPDIRSIKSASFNQKECAPAAHIRGLPYELIARRNKLAGIFSEGAQL